MDFHGPSFFRRSQLSAGIGKTVALARAKSRLTRRQVAGRAKIDYWTLGRIERGQQRPSPETLRNLAGALGVTMEALSEEWGEVEFKRSRSGAGCLGVGFRVIRQRAGITLRQAAEAASVSISTLSRFERGVVTLPRKIAVMGGDGSYEKASPALTSLRLAKLLGFTTAAELTIACVDASEDDPDDS